VEGKTRGKVGSQSLRVKRGDGPPLHSPSPLELPGCTGVPRKGGGGDGLPPRSGQEKEVLQWNLLSGEASGKTHGSAGRDHKTPRTEPERRVWGSGEGEKEKAYKKTRSEKRSLSPAAERTVGWGNERKTYLGIKDEEKRAKTHLGFYSPRPGEAKKTEIFTP